MSCQHPLPSEFDDCRLTRKRGRSDGAALKPSSIVGGFIGDVYSEVSRPTMDGTRYSPQDLVEVWRRKPRTLVLCFDGTSNEFCKRVRHAIFLTILFNSFDVNRDLLEYECCQALFYLEEGRTRVPNMLLSGAFFIHTQRTS